ncbi:MAG: NF038130 family PEP-CTERM protein [Leptolyngbyaceae cyanobacterium]
MKDLFNSLSITVGLLVLAALPATAQTTSGTVEIFNQIAPGVVAPGGTAADALNGIGNIELGETDGGLDGLQGGLTLELGGGTLNLSSITQADWDSGLADIWFDDAWAAYGADIESLGSGFTRESLRSAFDAVDADARLSDPNIASVGELDNGDVEIDLAGFFELNSLIDIALERLGLGAFLPLPPLPPLVASEVVAYDYQGESGFLYSIGEAPAVSGVVSSDGTASFTGNYRVTLDAPSGEVSVPEPSVMVGFATVAGLAWLNSRRKSSAG